MTWTPTARLIVDGITYGDDVLSGVTVTRGRDAVWEQPQAGYVSASLLFHDTAPPFQLQDTVTVTLEDSVATPVTLFTGTLSDLTTTFDSSGTVARAFSVQLVATGTLALVARSEIGADGYPQELDGDRVAAVLGEALAVRWETVPGALRWLDVDPLTTWADYQSPLVGTIDPGVYDVAAFPGSIANGYTLAATAANAGDGYLFEETDGTISYRDSASRQADATANGWTTLPSSWLMAGGLSISERLGDVVNRAVITVPSQDPVVVSFDPAIRAVGIMARSFDWSLADTAAATARGERLTELLGYPREVMDRFTVPVHAMSDVDVDLFLSLDLSQPIELLALPPAILGGGVWRGFIEGMSWSIGRTTAFLDLTVSDQALSTYTTRWTDVFATKTWTDIATDTPTLDWTDAYGAALEAA